MQYLQITPPNTCALLSSADGSQILYTTSVAPAKIWPAAGLINFEQFTTSEAALARALELNPSWITNPILGPLTLDPVNVSPSEVSAYAGDSLTLNCEYSCGDCVVTYEWLNPGGLPIPGATSSSLTLSNLTEKLDGVYTCNASASNEKGQTGSASGSFKVTVYPAIVPGADVAV